MEKAKARILAGVFFVSLSTLMLELVLTRIFSVTMWYHFTFMAVSLALFGMSASGICVYTLTHRFPKEKLQQQLALFALLFSLSISLSFIVHISTPLLPGISSSGFIPLGLTYGIIAVPFFLGGLCLSLALTHLARDVSKLYFADLFGASVGCVLTIPALTFFGGPGAIVVTSIFACVAALSFGSIAKDKRLLGASIAICLIFVVLLVVNDRTNVLRIRATKIGHPEECKLHEKWNAFSRIAVYPRLMGGEPFGWQSTGSDNYEGCVPDELIMTLDAAAVTVITEFDGDLRKVEHLRYDVTALVHYLKGNASVLIIGPGGGRDVLAALAFHQREIYGVEINPLIVDVVNNLYGDFSGHLYSQPGVNIVLDEGRSYIARLGRKFNIIQSSLTDTWAATSAGAFMLTENNLYTQEAFIEYYDHLDEDGILTLSRWYYVDCPGEMLRLVSLGLAAWRGGGIDDPAQHIIVVRREGEGSVVGTLLIKKSKFLPSEIEQIEGVSQEMGFEVVYTPLHCNDKTFLELITAPDPVQFYRAFPIDVSPPTDDKPFFFHMLRVKDFFAKRGLSQGIVSPNVQAIFILGNLLLIVTFLTMLFILGPLWAFKRASLRGAQMSFLLYFACLGLGFMMVEIPLVQRFTLFLGHPIYALSVILFSLLIFSGVGSLLTNFVRAPTRSNLRLIILTLVILLSFYAFCLPEVLRRFMDIGIPGRIAMSILFLLPLGLLMGMPFPMGIKLVNREASGMIPWVWGVNGAASVFASVLAIVVAINSGFTSALIIGLLAYFAAAFSIGYS